MEGKKLDAKEDLGNMEIGKTTIRTVFKNSSDTNTLKIQIESSEKEIENLGVLHEIVTIYLG